MAERYDTTRFGELYYASQNPPVENLGLAALYLRQLFEHYNVTAAFLGGWAVFLRGSGRSTNDLDVTVGCNISRLLQILSVEPRICIPVIHGATCIQIFVKTGGTINPGHLEVAISADIIINGNLGTPANIPNGTEEIIPVETTQGTDNVRVIDLYHQMSTKLNSFYSRQAFKDYADITFLLALNGDSIYKFSAHLDQVQREHYAENYAGQNSMMVENVLHNGAHEVRKGVYLDMRSSLGFVATASESTEREI